MIAQIKGLAKPSMSIHPMESPAVCLVSIEVSYLTVTSDCSCLVIIIIITDREVLGQYCYWSGRRGFFFRRFD